VTGLVVLALGSVVLVAEWIGHKDGPDSIRISVLTGWLFFTVVSAYYNGAMTMFFSTDVTVPFTDMRSVLRAYPKWQLRIMEGQCSTAKMFLV